MMHVTQATNSTPVAINGDCAASWERVRAGLREQVGIDAFDGFLNGLEFRGIESGTVHLTTPTRFLQHWIVRHYVERVLALWQAERHGLQRVTIDIRGPERRSEPACAQRARLLEQREKAGPPAAPIVPPVALTPSAAADPRLTFKTFVPGDCNAMALAAAQQIADLPAGETPVFNPIYFHGGPGLGKTHLLRAIEQHASADRRRLHYLASERFCLGLSHGLQARTLDAWRRDLHEFDGLIIDDAQFIVGRAASTEFSRMVQAMLDLRRPVVIAADRMPADLANADEQLRSRIAGGLPIELSPLNVGVRYTILERLAIAAELEMPGFRLTDALLTVMAARIQGTGRDLAGVMNRLRFAFQLSRVPPTGDMVESAIAELYRPIEPKPPSIEEIQRTVARHFNVSRADMLSARRTANVVRPRQIAMYLAKTLTLRSLPEIGRRFGGRDHTTVLHAVRKIDTLKQRDPELSERLDALKQVIATAT